MNGLLTFNKNTMMTRLFLLLLFIAGTVAVQAQPAVQSAGSKGNGGSAISSIIISKPDGLAAGDLMVACIGYESGSDVCVSPPASWTAILKTDNGSNCGISTFWKIASANDASAISFEFIFLNSNCSGPTTKKNSGGIVRITGHDPTNPINIQSGVPTSSSTSHVAPSITPTVSNTLVLAFYGVKKSATFSGGFGTERFDVSADPPSTACYSYSHVSGATGPKTVTSSETEIGVAQQIAIAPAPVPGGTVTIPFTTSGTFTVPNCVTSLTVKAWGGGGGSTITTNTHTRGGGGGGGAFASSEVTVVAGTQYNFTVGSGRSASTAGTNTTFNTNTVVAAGGSGGTNNSSTAGAGGTDAIPTIGTIKYAGGNGATGGSAFSGGGGGGAGTTGAGGIAPTAASGSFGAGTSNAGGNGGASVSGGTNGNSGSTFGGGGSGACTNSSTNRIGGSGANGLLRITYILPNNPTITLTNTTASACFSTSAQNVTLAYSATTGCPDMYSIDFASGITDVVNDNLSGSSITIALPANLAAGTYTGTLTVMNSTYGFVSGTYSISVTVHSASSEGQWIGMTSTDWFTASNWCNSVPNDETSVIIPSNALRYPNISGTGVNAEAKELTIMPGASLTFSSTRTLELHGFLTNNGTFTPGTGTVDFAGGNNHIISGTSATTFNNLSLNIPSKTIQLSTPVQINGALTLNNGYIISSSQNLLTMGASSTVTGTNDNSLVIGPVQKIGNTDFTFPIGAVNEKNANKYTYYPIQLTPVGGTLVTAAYTAEYFRSNALAGKDMRMNINESKGGLQGISPTEYWKVDRNVGTSNVDVTLWWHDKSTDKTTYFDKRDKLVVAHLYGVTTATPTWELATETSTVTLTYNDVTKWGSVKVTGYDFQVGSSGTGDGVFNPVNGAGEFSGQALGVYATEATNNGPTSSNLTLGDMNAGALPVTLTSFNARLTPESKVSLSWATASESVNKGFRIERHAASNGMVGKFEKIGFVSSKAPNGNSQSSLFYSHLDEKPLKGTSFYRLVQEDLDGTLTNSEVRLINFMGSETVVLLFPNPSNGDFTISRTPNGKSVGVEVYDISGRLIKRLANTTATVIRFHIDQPGLYNLKLICGESGAQSIQRIVIQ